MKTIFNIFLMAFALVLAQACGSKPKEAMADSMTADATASDKAAKEKQEAADVRAAAQKERLRVAAEKRAAAEAFYKEDSGDIIYNRSEVAPSFPGGEDAMMKYFRENLKYPEGAKTIGWEGTVYIEFIVGKDGKARSAKVTEETEADTDQGFKDEAIRVVDNMPAWTPGTQKGKPVHVRFNLPIAFKLS